jgi:hypothetical protein
MPRGVGRGEVNKIVLLMKEGNVMRRSRYIGWVVDYGEAQNAF